MNRRAFLARSASIAAAVALPAPLRGDPYRPWTSLRAAGPVRIRGRVVAGGRGVARAGVSDGITVVSSGADGSFDLVSEGAQPFVMLSPPPGFEIPTQATGTFGLFQPIRADRNSEMAIRFELAPLRTSDDRHTFLVLADTQTQDQPEMARLHAETVPDVRATVGKLGEVPLFGVADGDIMYDDLALYAEYERAVGAMAIPFAQVVGNHDLDLTSDRDEASTATFQRHFGPTYYSFNRGRVHYVVLDDVFFYGGGYLGYLSDRQLTWLARDLARVEPGAPVVVFLHIPLHSQLYARHNRPRPEISNTVTNREALVRLLEPYPARVISGHTHEMDHRREGRVIEHTLGTVCGAWWTGDICYDGTPNGYAVFEVKGESFQWRYKATGQPDDHQIRLYPRGADPRAPDEIVANVWNWDQAWTVTYRVNGESKGLMARRRGLDPRSASEHQGEDKPAKRTWVDPVVTEHLFYAPVEQGTSVVVEARDPWGEVYRAQV
ncbi:MAG TPA: calcineurin-like phosphoesterase C-terminal domain-containing protein [Gemmatimonadales bacterium]